MILQGVGHPISCLGVCYANDPKKGGYKTPAPALDLTTSLRGDFSELKSSWHRRRRSKNLAVSLKRWKGRRGGGLGGGRGVQGEVTPPPPTVYSPSNTSLPGGPFGDFVMGKNEILQKGNNDLAVFRTQTFGLLGSAPPPKGVALIFIPAGGGGGLRPPSLPWTPYPPPPSALIQLRLWVLGTFFIWANFFLPHLRRTFSRVLWSLHCVLPSLYCKHHVPTSHKCVLQHPGPTMSQRKTQRRCKRDPLFLLPR